MNKPVAWMNKINEEWVTTTPDDSEDEWIPLYTHPVKELTDEEIKQIFDMYYMSYGYLEFARAILRKAGKK